MATYYVDLENGVDATGLLDSSTTAVKTVTLTGSAEVTAVRGKFDGTALDLITTATAGGGMTTPDHADWAFGAGKFTVECWAYFNSHTANAIEAMVSQWHTTASGLGWFLGMNSSNQLAFHYSTLGTDLTNNVGGAYTPPLGQWVHFAADRDASNVLRVYADGVVIASATISATFFDGTRALYVGNSAASSQKFPGWIDEVRITKGVARYAGAFTPPTAPFPDSVGAGDASFASVGLLLHMNSAGSYATRAKNLTAVTAAKLQPGDTIRVMASKDETLIGNCTWTDGSKTVTLPSAVTLTIADCEAVWTGSTNITQSASTTVYKEGTKSAASVVATAFTTGKVAYFATGTLDLSAYQQVSFWFRSSLALAAGVFELRLCSDTLGVTAVHSIPIPANPGSGIFFPVTLDFGTNLSSAIASVALYALVDPGTPTVYIDHIIACKASSSPDSLTLHSLIGKVWNKCWQGATVYAANDIRKPSQPMRNGYRYQVTAGGGGASGATEPSWPAEIGATVIDGDLTWTCVDLEDSWYAIQSIVGTTVKIDNGTATLASAGRGYSGATETVATYKREPVLRTMLASGLALSAVRSGTVAAPITYSGGWNRTDMSTQSGETWFSMQNSSPNGIGAATFTYNCFNNLNVVRSAYGLYLDTSNTTFVNCHAAHCAIGIYGNNVLGGIVLRGISARNNVGEGWNGSNYSLLWSSARAISVANNIGAGSLNSASYVYDVPTQDLHAENNGTYGVDHAAAMARTISGLVTRANGTAGVNIQTADLFLINSSLTDATPIAAIAASRNIAVHSHNHGQVLDNHLIQTDGGTIIAATDRIVGGSGISWKFRPTATSRNSGYPLELAVAKVACSANGLVTLSIQASRDNANIAGRLLVRGGQIKGVPDDVSVSLTPTVDASFHESSGLTFTPTEAGVIEVVVQVWDGVGTTNNFWIDSFNATQA